MFEAWRAPGAEVAVLGLGKSGVAAARLLRANGVAVYASDGGRTPALEAQGEVVRAAGAAVDIGRHDLDRLRRAAALVVSPGIPPGAAALAAARDAGVPVLAEAELGLRCLSNSRVIAITGTNGKTTTTAMTAHLLDTAGLRAAAAGNIGRPLSEVALEARPPDWLAVELSSFQLHDTPGLAPAAGVLTNLAPDHLDRYPSLAEYYGDKALLFRNADAGSTWITNGDDPAVQEMVRAVPGRHERFSTAGTTAAGWYDRAGGRLMLGAEPLLPRAELPLLGDHNVANALAAALAARVAGVAPGDLAAGLRSFRALTHRLEPVREVGGVLWINDSKATNIASTEVALAALDRPYVLLLGGRHKGEPYTRLGPLLARRCRAVVAYGEAGELVKADLEGVVRVVGAGAFDEVLQTARRLAQPGDAVLLSPACSSYDMFNNYEERGAAFRAAVEAL
ncbi:MAG TPA: UDP-N-acetylmuramoyl-L-alanine--D-glutamate ligase [Gemmatimonadales bacterium]|nr:UDP-N-acetylmuramoyl-L-alanine--D-glutamate ligase [Gemmatimonadales bacterium]